MATARRFVSVTGHGVTAMWPFPVDRVEARQGLTYVYSPDPDGFTVDQYWKVPGEDRTELLDGVIVIHPPMTAHESKLVSDLYETLRRECPEHLDVRMGPIDIRVGPMSIYAPNIVAWRPSDPVPALVVEVRKAAGSYYRWHERVAKTAGYREFGVPSYWVLDPMRPAVTVYEFTYGRKGSFPLGEVCAAGEENRWSIWARVSA